MMAETARPASTRTPVFTRRCSTAASRSSLTCGPGRHAWVQLVSGELDVNGTRLAKGDGAAISGESQLALASVGGNGAAEFLLFDLA